MQDAVFYSHKVETREIACCSCCWVINSCLSLCDPVDCNLLGSSVHRISQARILKWVAMPFYRRPSRPRDWTCISCITGVIFTAEPPGGETAPGKKKKKRCSYSSSEAQDRLGASHCIPLLPSPTLAAPGHLGWGWGSSSQPLSTPRTSRMWRIRKDNKSFKNSHVF